MLLGNPRTPSPAPDLRPLGQSTEAPEKRKSALKLEGDSDLDGESHEDDHARDECGDDEGAGAHSADGSAFDEFEKDEPANVKDRAIATLFCVMQPPRTRLAAGAAALALLASACGGSSGEDTTTVAASPTSQAAAPATTATAEAQGESAAAPADAATGETREAVLRLSGETLDGGTFDTEAYVGQDVLLWFWAPW
jgi:hypothetical protein